MAKGGEQQRKQTHKHDSEAPEVTEEAVASEKTETLKDDIDELLDEIDDVLEQNAEEFVRSYIQKGGE